MSALASRLAMIQWFFRRAFWDGVALFKVAMNKPLVIPVPADGKPDRIEPVPIGEAIKGLQMANVLVAPQSQTPPDERQFAKTLVYRLQVALYRLIPPMQPGLPPINPDPQIALRRAYGRLHRHFIPPPLLPAEFLGVADLGSLAARGPYAGYTQRRANGGFEWDLRELSGYDTHAGLLRLGCHVHFELDPLRRALRATRIDSALGTATPDTPAWERAVQMALCTATTHLSLVRHFNHVHLAGGAMIAIAARNELPGEHPLMRLLFPYIYGTQQSNDMVTRGQMLPGGDFESTFSFPMNEMCRLFGDTYPKFDLLSCDPAEDARRRGVTGQGFDTPTEDNLAALFDLMLEHARRYLRIYWRDDAALQADEAIEGWREALDKLMPGGSGLGGAPLTHETLARLVARCLYLAAVQHELLGSFIWNYQLWTHRQPVRMQATGEREPLDVYQRLVNANFNLNVHRRLLGEDFSALGLDRAGKGELQRFASALAVAQRHLERRPWTVWTLYPAVLKVNINA